MGAFGKWVSFAGTPEGTVNRLSHPKPGVHVRQYRLARMDQPALLHTTAVLRGRQAIMAGGRPRPARDPRPAWEW